MVKPGGIPAAFEGFAHFRQPRRKGINQAACVMARVVDALLVLACVTVDRRGPPLKGGTALR